MARLTFPIAIIAAASSAATVLGASSEICPTLYADFARRQLAEFSTEDPFVLEEGQSAKHIPFLTLSEDGKTGTVVVGNGDVDGGVWHPMAASGNPEEVHFVTHIMVKDQDGNVVVAESLDPTVAAPATMTFDVPAGATDLVPYEWCNKHGLWKGESVSVSSSDEGIGEVCTIDEFPMSAWESVHADFMRQQSSDTFDNEGMPFDESDGEKHTPYITLNDDGTASILVGKVGGAIHPMKTSPDGVEEPHWITEIYVVDQTGNIVTMSTLDPTGVDTATIDFTVPESAETLQAYSWCNLHGLWKGPVVEIGTASAETKSNGSVAHTSIGFVFAAAALTVLHIM